MSEPSERALAAAREWQNGAYHASSSEGLAVQLATIIDRHMNPLDDYGAMVQLHQLFTKADIGTVYSDRNMEKVIDIIRRTGREVSNA